MYKLRPYQQDMSDEIMALTETHDRVLGVLPTGGGKSLIITDVINRLKGRTLILTHREEILKQNMRSIDDVGVLTAKTLTNQSSNIVIAMVETFHSRAERFGYDFLGKFDNVVTDESHILVFQKVYDKIEYKKLIGFTATPTILKTEVVVVKDVEFVKRITMSDFFDVMVEGAKVSELIEWGFLTREVAYSLKVPNFDRKEENTHTKADYTNKELDKIYSNKTAKGVLLNTVKEHCMGKKTIIFNATTKVNKEVEELLSEVGLPILSYDSVNYKKEHRHEVIKEFTELKEVILINTNVFTTGFDVSDIDVVIVNRATKSLSLWVQMVGRASRVADGKKLFTSIDLGQNIDAFGKWSSDIDWRSEFKEKPLKKKNKTDILQIWECDNCGAFNTHDETECVVCGADKPARKPSTKTDKSGVLELVGDAPILPSGLEVIRYTKRIDKGSSFAFKLIDSKIKDVVVYSGITKAEWKTKRVAVINRISSIYRPLYFAVIKSSLKGKNRKYSTQLTKLLKNIHDAI